MRKNTIESKQWLDKRYGDSASGKSTIIDWYAEFKCGHKGFSNRDITISYLYMNTPLNFFNELSMSKR